MENIKNFIEEGEKEFEEKFWKTNCEIQGTKFMTDWHKHSQISLIKMIVEMVESEKKDGIALCMGCDCNEEYNQALDTISSKLSSLVNGEK